MNILPLLIILAALLPHPIAPPAVMRSSMRVEASFCQWAQALALRA